MATIKIPLTQRKYALIDEEDAALIAAHRWYASKSGPCWYAVTNARNGHTVRKMHRLILNAPAGVDVDHINGDGLDNRRCNLRLATRAQNNANNRRVSNSGYKGVRWNEQCGGWIVEVKSTYVGVYETKEEAALAHDIRALEVFGEYANLNLPRDFVLGQPMPKAKRGKRHWTDEEDRLLLTCHTLEEAAMHVRRSVSGCKQRMHRLQRAARIASYHRIG